MDDRRLTRVLKQHLRNEQILGVDAVPLGELDVDQAPRGSERLEPVVHTDGPTAHERVDSSPIVSKQERHSARGLENAKRDTAKPSIEPIEKPVAPAYHPIEPAKKAGLLEDLNVNEISTCEKCELCTGRTQAVFGEGDPNANLLFIGEGPGQKEDEQGRPFVGRSGQLLEKMIVAMGLSRERVFIANLVKCRPPNNRTPLAGEVQTCWPYLLQQISIIQPKVIVTLGGPSTKQILGTKNGITALRGKWHQFTGLLPQGPSIPVMPTFHPAYLLRAYTQENRAKVWSDLQAALAFLDE